ncbi:MAG TPA: twin-arginine translocase subunit TatB [Gammaproteobacteria bacterium]|jgi:sec-independent protein translocase protein TatB|nr:twin-arginine translocase subunit TatB [Gammaproteobacteria bacterium]
MFDVGFSEVVIIAIIALVILGPERLPKVARTIGFWVGKARRMVADVKTDIDREMRESELADLRKLGDEISDVKNEFQSAAGKVADDSGVESVVESIKKSADDIQSSVSDVTAADEIQSSVSDVTATNDSAQSAENESPVDDTTDTSQTKDKQIPTS